MVEWGHLKWDAVLRAQVELLLGDPAKARTKLGWNPQKTSLQQLVEEMVDADIEMALNPNAYLKY